MFSRFFRRTQPCSTVLPPLGKSVMRETVSTDAAELIEKLKRERDRLKADAVDNQRLTDHQADIIRDQQREIAELRREMAADKLWIRSMCRLAAQRGEVELGT